MRYDDLLNTPYKPHGRGNGGYDCYGLVVEMCRRDGKTLADPYSVAELPLDAVNDYISRGINVRRTDAPKPGCLVECSWCGKLHIGYITERGKMIHATKTGVKVSPIAVMRPIAYYEVIE